MDGSREGDLKYLKAIINNPKKSLASKREAHKTARHIIEEMKDKTLRKLRHRLVSAARATDMDAEWKLSNQIREYQKKERNER